jgi:hypothetical protein
MKCNGAFHNSQKFIELQDNSLHSKILEIFIIPQRERSAMKFSDNSQEFIELQEKFSTF